MAIAGELWITVKVDTTEAEARIKRLIELARELEESYARAKALGIEWLDDSTTTVTNHVVYVNNETLANFNALHPGLASDK